MITREAAEINLQANDEQEKARLTSWLVEERRLGVDAPEVTPLEVEDAKSRRRLSVHERAESTSVRATSYGWAVDYETAEAARAAALRECGSGCSVVLSFARCAAYAADQDANSSAVGLGRVDASADGARQAALAEGGSRGGSGCVVRVWGCNGPVVEEGLGLDRAGRREGPAGPSGGGVRRWPCGRDVRAADADGDPEVADIARGTGDGVSGRGVCGVAAAVGGGSADVPSA